MCAISAVCQFNIAETIFVITIVDQYVVRFDVYFYELQVAKSYGFGLVRTRVNDPLLVQSDQSL